MVKLVNLIDFGDIQKIGHTVGVSMGHRRFALGTVSGPWALLLWH